MNVEPVEVEIYSNLFTTQNPESNPCKLEVFNMSYKDLKMLNDVD